MSSRNFKVCMYPALDASMRFRQKISIFSFSSFFFTGEGAHPPIRARTTRARGSSRRTRSDFIPRLRSAIPVEFGRDRGACGAHARRKVPRRHPTVGFK